MSAAPGSPLIGARIARMLMKKLESIVWKPSAVSVTPGIDQPHRVGVVERAEVRPRATR